MSEINSIANGTFTIGQTSATNFIAGNGITIDSPSAGTVRIGNDETVIYSGNATVTATTGINTNEPYTNFEKIKVYGRTINNQAQRLYGEALITSADSYIPFSLTYPAGNNDSLRCCSFHFELTSTDRTLFIVDKGKIWNINNNSVSTGVFGGTITKIVGINRISGGNE